jgi:hypothetical protein
MGKSRARKDTNTACHMIKDSGHTEYTKKRGTIEGKGNYSMLGSKGNNAQMKHGGEKANELVKCLVIGEVESEGFVALVTTVKMKSFTEVEKRIKPIFGFERLNRSAAG